MPPHKQNRNWALEQQLMAKFQSRREAQFYWKSAVSTLLALPALRAAWSMSSVGHTFADIARDLSGGGNHLTGHVNVDFGYDVLIPYVEFDGAAAYLWRTDAGAIDWADIIGGESYVIPTQRGLTIGGWFYADALTAAMVTMGKGTGGGAAVEQYMLFWRGDLANDPFLFRVSTGAALTSVTSSVITATGGWYFVAGRFTPSTDVEIFVNGTWDAAGAAPALLTDLGNSFTIGASSAPGAYLNGRASLCFLCACAAPKVAISQFYHQTRVMFGHV